MYGINLSTVCALLPTGWVSWSWHIVGRLVVQIYSFLSFTGSFGKDGHLSHAATSAKGSYFRVWAWLALILICANGANSETLSRINYGVLFQSKGQVSAIYDYWAHMFETEFPVFNVSDSQSDLSWSPMNPSNTCMNPSNTCMNLSLTAARACLYIHHALHDVARLRSRNNQRLLLALRLAQEVMPSHHHSRDHTLKSRSKRAPFWFHWLHLSFTFRYSHWKRN